MAVTNIAVLRSRSTSAVQCMQHVNGLMESSNLLNLLCAVSLCQAVQLRLSYDKRRIKRLKLSSSTGPNFFSFIASFKSLERRCDCNIFYYFESPLFFLKKRYTNFFFSFFYFSWKSEAMNSERIFIPT